ncbi:MAG: SDR family oxidoreductase [Deltaproteobacteria bacterium]|nr:SDR family oxidoreductase [Deltaproteobacteria bacterium]MBK9368002.1 SDR family oxidoreductase [Deltaproteobacteria bacterium]MBK9649567.1 SDR family oxidoreductase [Deltaproteobacteria bacterium]
MSGKRIVVIGAGVVGRALTRALHARGDQVTVLSPKPVNLPALWRLTDAVSGEGLRRGVRGAQIVVFAASAQDPKGADEVLRLGAHHAAAAAAHAGAERFVLIGPVGARAGNISSSLRAHHEGTLAARRLIAEARTIRLPWLFGEGDQLLDPWLERARQGRRLPVPASAAPIDPLWLGDAVRALLKAVDEPLPSLVTELRGPERLGLDELAERVGKLFGVKRTLIRPWPERPEDLRRLPEQQTGPDQWGELGLGDRLKIGEHLERSVKQRYG